MAPRESFKNALFFCIARLTIHGQRITPPEERERFVKKLHEQIGFISRSCLSFDLGIEDEAIRIATATRRPKRSRAGSMLPLTSCLIT